MSRITQNMKILIIDDNPELVNVFAKMLQIKGFFVTTETTIKAGLYRLDNESYDVVFVDAPLDNYDGKQILTLLQENQIFQKTTVYLFSGVDFDNIELDEWKKCGLHSYLKKPVKRSVIMKVLDDVRMQINFINFQIASEPIIKYEKPLLVH